MASATQARCIQSGPGGGGALRFCCRDGLVRPACGLPPSGLTNEPLAAEPMMSILSTASSPCSKQRRHGHCCEYARCDDEVRYWTSWLHMSIRRQGSSFQLHRGKHVPFGSSQGSSFDGSSTHYHPTAATAMERHSNLTVTTDLAKAAGHRSGCLFTTRHIGMSWSASDSSSMNAEVTSLMLPARSWTYRHDP